MSKVTALKYCRKINLQHLTGVLGDEIEERDIIAAIIQKIEDAGDYDADFALSSSFCYAKRPTF